jgi:hypothetical protein
LRGMLREHRTLRPLVVGLLLLAAVACSDPPREDDLRRLDQLKAQFGNRYEFKLEPPHYLRVRSLTNQPPVRDDLRAVYKVFWLDPMEQPRTNTDYVYLNAYDKAGEWIVQLAWDPASKRVVEERRREHY